MATYNGAAYLQAQLDSFKFQTRLPNELVVCDDGSNDGTLALLESFAVSAPFKVRIIRNHERLGYTQNFAKAMSLCEGELIFLSDQDDVWYPSKLQIVCGVFVNQPECMLVANDSDLVDENLNKSGLTIVGQFKAIDGNGIQFVNGCCSALRRSILEIVLPIPRNSLVAHDGWLHELAYYTGTRLIIPDVLQLYRRHRNNVTQSIAASLKSVSWVDDYRKYQGVNPCDGYQWEIEKLNLIANRLEQMEHAIEPIDVQQGLARIRRAIAAHQKRITILGYNRLVRPWYVGISYVCGNYAIFRGWKSALKDVVR